MRVLLLNPPHPIRLQRRYVASYYAPNFLVPPTELMTLGAIARAREGGEALLVDAIAEGLDAGGVVARARGFAPDLVVSLAGLGSFDADLRALDEIRRALPTPALAPSPPLVVFGHLPTVLPGETLRRTAADVVLRNEPERPFAALLDRLAAHGPGEHGGHGAFADLEGIPGLAWKRGGEVFRGPEPERDLDLDSLPWPDYGLIDPRRYRESFLRGPIAPVLTSRGCPHRCTYCVRTHGRRVVNRSVESVLAEIEHVRRAHGIRRIRFMDDTFALERERCAELCRGLVRRGLDVEWSALTRAQGLEAGDLALMRRSGCRRLYVGIESGSQRVLDAYGKGATLDGLRRGVAAIRAARIEVLGFFIVGGPGETEAELRASIDFAHSLDLDDVIVTRLQHWPGTELFRRLGEGVRFSLVPTRVEVAGPDPARPVGPDPFAWERRFYRAFYLRPRLLLRHAVRFLRTPRDAVEGAARLLAHSLRREARDLV